MAAVTFTAMTVTAVSASACPSPAQVFGQPDGLGFVVTDVESVRRQLQSAVGLDFQPSKRVTVSVRLADDKAQTVTLKSSTTRADQPSTEVVEAQPSIGPWAVHSGRATPFLSYSVSDISIAGALLRRAGFNPTAESAHVGFWQGLGGVLVRLVDEETPSGSLSNDAPPPAALTLYPCDVDGVQKQLTDGLGVTWSGSQTFKLRWALADGTERLHTSTSTTTQDGQPFLAIEAPHEFPGEDPCSEKYTPYYLVSAAQNVAQAEDRAANAGMHLIARVPDQIAAYRGANGLSLEIVNPAFLPQQ
ncbi:hypothetical protein AB0H37_38120 [Actinomadura sp. NPDC023710]|uniref:hypothetical protein n=1 Tax=Actinomadura sp. NPDC023710 TaxID=3158219 RepID=UPI0033D8CA14